MAGAKLPGNVTIIFGSLIFVPDQQANGRAGRLAFKDAR